MALQPGVVLLVGVEIVKDDFEPPVRILSNHVVHEGEKLLAAPTLLVGSLDLTGRHLEGGKQRRGAVALVVVTVSRQGASCARSSAWIEGFSSTQRTTAFFG